MKTKLKTRKDKYCEKKCVNVNYRDQKSKQNKTNKERN